LALRIERVGDLGLIVLWQGGIEENDRKGRKDTSLLDAHAAVEPVMPFIGFEGAPHRIDADELLETGVDQFSALEREGAYRSRTFRRYQDEGAR